MAMSYALAPMHAAPITSFQSINNNKNYKNLINGNRSKWPASNLTVRSRLKRLVEVVTAPADVLLVDGFQPAIITPPTDLSRDDFHSNFLFGASTSALQVIIDHPI